MDVELRREICRRMGGHDYDLDGECRTCFHVMVPIIVVEELLQ